MPLHGRLWVASSGNMPVGFALVKMLADDLPHLEEIDVHPSHRRRGLGTAETLSPELAAVVSEEAHRGMDAHTRAVMGYRCGPPAIRQ